MFCSYSSFVNSKTTRASTTEKSWTSRAFRIRCLCAHPLRQAVVARSSLLASFATLVSSACLRHLMYSTITLLYWIELFCLGGHAEYFWIYRYRLPQSWRLQTNRPKAGRNDCEVHCWAVWHYQARIAPNTCKVSLHVQPARHIQGELTQLIPIMLLCFVLFFDALIKYL